MSIAVHTQPKTLTAPRLSRVVTQHVGGVVASFLTQETYDAGDLAVATVWRWFG